NRSQGHHGARDRKAHDLVGLWTRYARARHVQVDSRNVGRRLMAHPRQLARGSAIRAGRDSGEGQTAMSWRVARSLLTLRDQVNRMAPDRDKSSDGTIGDEHHQTTKSEHNPDANGVVRAMDITHDPAHGVDARKLAEALVASRDTRILYLISNAQIVSSVVKPWIWRRYNGVNPHRHHMHISVVPEPNRYDDIRPWDLSALELKEDADATSPQTPDASSVPASAGRGYTVIDRRCDAAIDRADHRNRGGVRCAEPHLVRSRACAHRLRQRHGSGVRARLCQMEDEELGRARDGRSEQR